MNKGTAPSVLCGKAEGFGLVQPLEDTAERGPCQCMWVSEGSQALLNGNKTEAKGRNWNT